MKKYLFVIAIIVATPLIGFAAYNDVSIGSPAVINSNGANLSVTGSADVVESLTVSATDFSVVMKAGSTLTISSADKYVINY
jgi:hypothetical protein